MLNFELEVNCQTMLFLVMCASYLSQTSLNWLSPTKLDADVMGYTTRVEIPIVTENCLISFVFRTDASSMVEY